jgi:hypothetical protein
LIEEVTAHAQSDSLEDAREICADGTYFQSNLRIFRTTELALIWSAKTYRHEIRGWYRTTWQQRYCKKQRTD